MATGRFAKSCLCGLVSALLLVACSGDEGPVAADSGPGDTVAANPLRRGQVLDASYPTLDSSTRSFADHRGRPVVVNFFSTTCVPCRQEMPDLEAVKQRRGDAVTWVGLDVFDTVDNTREMVDQTGVTWEIGRDTRGDLLRRLGGTGLPLTVVLDRQGAVVFSFAGTIVDHLGQLDDALDQAASSAGGSGAS